jgi:hypothetical protein
MQRDPPIVERRQKREDRGASYEARLQQIVSNKKILTNI